LLCCRIVYWLFCMPIYYICFLSALVGYILLSRKPYIYEYRIPGFQVIFPLIFLIFFHYKLICLLFVFYLILTLITYTWVVLNIRIPKKSYLILISHIFWFMIIYYISIVGIHYKHVRTNKNLKRETWKRWNNIDFRWFGLWPAYIHTLIHFLWLCLFFLFDCTRDFIYRERIWSLQVSSTSTLTTINLIKSNAICMQDSYPPICDMTLKITVRSKSNNDSFQKSKP